MATEPTEEQIKSNDDLLNSRWRTCCVAWIRENTSNVCSDNEIIDNIKCFVGFDAKHLIHSFIVLLKDENEEMTNHLPRILDEFGKYIWNEQEVIPEIFAIIPELFALCTPTAPYVVLERISKILVVVCYHIDAIKDKKYIIEIVNMLSVLIMSNNNIDDVTEAAILAYMYLIESSLNSDIDILKLAPSSNESQQKLRNYNKKIFDESMKTSHKELKNIGINLHHDIIKTCYQFYDVFANEKLDDVSNECCLVQIFLTLLKNNINDKKIVLRLIKCCGAILQGNDHMFFKYYPEFLIISKKLLSIYGDHIILEFDHVILETIYYISMNEINYELMVPWIDPLIRFAKEDDGDYSVVAVCSICCCIICNCILSGINGLIQKIISCNFIPIFFRFYQKDMKKPTLSQYNDALCSVVENILNLKKYGIYKQIKNESKCLTSLATNSSIPQPNHTFIQNLLNIIDEYQC